MDRINGLSDELLIHILSFLPTQVAVSTSMLSKRWECLWMWLPKLEYVSRNPSRFDRDDSKLLWMFKRESLLRCFLDKSLPLHKASVIKSFGLDLAWSSFKPEDVKLWVVIAVSRSPQELEITHHDYLYKGNILPSSLYACKSLVTLKLVGNILLDVPRMVGLPSLKELQLQYVRFLDGESFRRLLSICHVLEHLLLKFWDGFNINMATITVIVPSLQNLSLYIPIGGHVCGFVINTPSLKYLKLVDHNKYNHSCLIEDMPKLEEAYVDVIYPDIERLIGSITSVKRLTLSSEAVYGGTFVFNQLEHLKLCLGTANAANLLVQLLESSPNLRELDLFELDHKQCPVVSWNQPQTVPKCIRSSLRTFNWSSYLGIPEDRDIAVYILTNACRLKTATISSDDRYTPKYEMLKELSLSYRASRSCRLVFD